MSIAVCPVCQSTSTELVSQVKDLELQTSDQLYDYYGCENCEAIFIHPQPLDQLAQIYPDHYYSNSGGDHQSILGKVKEYLDRRMFKKVTQPLKGEQLAALDVGGGSGWMLNVLTQVEPRVTYTAVVDINDIAKTAANRNGHDFFCSRIEVFETTRRYDVIILLNLIEHVANPAQVLTKMHQLLTPGGRLIIKTPNTDTLDRRLFINHYWGGLHCPRHWILFNAENFTRLANQQGLEVADLWYTQGAPQWTASILCTLSLKNWLSFSAQKQMSSHWLLLPVQVIGAAFDLLRAPFAKTAQFFTILTKQPQADKAQPRADVSGQKITDK